MPQLGHIALYPLHSRKKGADFGMNEVCPGWDILLVFPIRGKQGRTKYAL